MRNLLKYPVTKDEVEKAIAEAAVHFAQMELCGDPRPYILRRLLSVVERDFKSEDYAI